MRVLVSLMILAAAMGAFSGCTQPQSPGGSIPDYGNIPTTTVFPPVTVSAPPKTATVIPADPLIGMWRGYNNLPSGRIMRDWIFSENGTWIMTNTNVKSQKKKVIIGKWKKTGSGSYQIIPPDGAPDTFTYDEETDKFSDSYFRETYSRITGMGNNEQIPTMNITVHSARRVLSIGESHPYPGNIFLIVNITIKNFNETGWYMFTDENTWVVSDSGTGSSCMNRKTGALLMNAFPAGKILPGEERAGNVIFGVPEQSDSFTLKLFNGLGETISNIPELKKVPVTDEQG